MPTSRPMPSRPRQLLSDSWPPLAAAHQTLNECVRPVRILRVSDLVDRLNVSRASVYVLMATDPTFPKKLKLTARSIGFLESEVNAWIEARAQLRVVS
jgi:predicted DNA-binding transcriptional regulator AlpA